MLSLRWESALMGNKVLSLVTDRILGRTIDVNLKAFLWMGCISAGAGVVFLLAGLIGEAGKMTDKNPKF